MPRGIRNKIQVLQQGPVFIPANFRSISPGNPQDHPEIGCQGHFTDRHLVFAPEDQIQLAIDQCPVQCIHWQEEAA